MIALPQRQQLDNDILRARRAGARVTALRRAQPVGGQFESWQDEAQIRTDGHRPAERLVRRTSSATKSSRF